MTFGIDLSQLGQLSQKLKEFGEAVRDQVALEGVAAMAKVVYDDARTRAPISEAAHFFYGRDSKKTGVRYLFTPGNLQRAIYRAYSPEQSGPTKQMYRISWNHRKAPYGHMVEFGTSRAPAHPFLRPSLAVVPQAIEAGKARMGQALQSLGGTA
jgi:HK97 gp10 family phage protein